MHSPPDPDHSRTILESRPRRLSSKPRRVGWAIAIDGLLFLLLLLLIVRPLLAEEPAPDSAQPVPAEHVPKVGTFYSMTLFQPPLPYLPFEGLDVFALADGSFAYDDRSINYFGGGAQNSQSFGEGGQMMSLSEPPPPSPCPECPPCTNCPPDITNNPPYSVPGLKLTIPVLTNGWIYTTIFEHDPARGYDLYYLTNLNQTNWTAALGNLAGQTNYWLSNSFTADLFLRVASGLDSDGDLMLDGWELLHGFDPHSSADASQDADGDGLTNLQEFEQGRDPRGGGTWEVFLATPRGVSALP